MFTPLFDVNPTKLPEKFTFPFYYRPHPIALQAVSELQKRLMEEDFRHDFGIHNTIRAGAIGKMFGVLVVQKQSGEIGYLAAFSGKLGNSNEHPGFVPPVFDLLDEQGFFRREELEVNELTKKLEALQNDEHYLGLVKEFDQEQEVFVQWLSDEKRSLKKAKQERDQKRKACMDANGTMDLDLLEQLKHESIHHQLTFKNRQRAKQLALQKKGDKLALMDKVIQDLKEERAAMSASIQQRIFEAYTFLNPAMEEKSLLAIFKETSFQTPPAGAGECAAPKLLQYAYNNQLKPIALAEFWWGMSPDSEVKVHKEFYPACRGKCKPILAHMLKGVEMDINPMSINPAEGKELPIIFEDEYLLLVDKPAEFLSVPGKSIQDSVQTRIQHLYPQATGPLLVHRLDMSTSGIMLIAKQKDIHESLQKQFLKRTIVKRYTAVLNGYVKVPHGEVSLPLRVDLEDRPRQLVCFEHGKPALTKFEVIERSKGTTRIAFYPHTGRTHQLRVHAAHKKGLNAPIIGDDLYGQKADRLYLHAEYLSFWHPITKERMEISCPAPF